jgi:hypothetical protein
MTELVLDDRWLLAKRQLAPVKPHILSLFATDISVLPKKPTILAVHILASMYSLLNPRRPEKEARNEGLTRTSCALFFWQSPLAQP